MALLALRGFFNIVVIEFSVETPGDRVRDCDQQEIRYDHHAVHIPQHADDDTGPLPAERHVELRLGQPQYGLHRYFLHRVRAQDIRPSPVLFQRAVEHV